VALAPFLFTMLVSLPASSRELALWAMVVVADGH